MKLQLYVLRQLLVSLAFSVGGILFVALPGLAVSTVHRLPGADAVILLRYVPLALQTLAPYVLPICFLLAVVATYGRLAADREWTAIQMAGVRPLGLLMPPLFVAAVLGFTNHWMLTEQLPHLKARQRALLIEASTSMLRNLRPGRTSISLEDFQLHAQWMDPETRVLHEVFIRRPGTEEEGTLGDRIEYHARTAKLDFSDGVLHGTLTELLQFHPGEQIGQSYHDWVQFDLPLEYLEKPEPSRRARYRTSGEIERMLESGEVPKGQVPSYRFEVQYRRVLASTFLVFLALGAPIGLILRKGTQLGALAASSGVGLLYYILNMRIAKELGNSGTWPPALAAWSPTVLGLLVSIWLLRKALAR